MEPWSPEQAPQNLFEQRVRHYQKQVERLLQRSTKDFSEFTKGNEELVVKGDELLKTYETTGYNILRRQSDMSLTSRKSLIFYSNYIDRPRHFGLLLGTMENEGIVASDQIRFGVKASKVLYGNWNIDEDNERIVDFQRVDTQGNVSQDQVDETVEAVITFLPQEADQAGDIALFLDERTRAGYPRAIPESWAVPDIRATISLKGVLKQVGFQEVVANIFRRGQSRLIAARQKTKFPPPWRATPIGVNEELYPTNSGLQLLSW